MTWLHIPYITTSALPQESEVSISELNLEVAEALSRSAMWRSKRRQPQYWRRAWKKEPCLALLSGMTSTPSTQQRGADLWMESLRATRVNRSALPVGGVDSTIHEISGQQSSEQSSSVGQAGASSKMWRDTFGLDTSIMSSRDLKRLVTESRSKSSRRLKQVPPTEESDSSFWRWHTPTVDRMGQVHRSHVDGRTEPLKLMGQALRASGLPVPPRPDGKQWPTPQARDWKGASHPQADLARIQKHAASLAEVGPLHQWGLWPTPNSGQADKSTYNADRIQAQKWIDQGREVDLQHRVHLTGIIPDHSHPAQQQHRNGEPSSKTRHSSHPQLNPRFVEWLMGLPEGWVYRVPNNFVFWETE